MPTVYAAPVPRAPDPPHLVGRASEMAQLRALVQEASLGNGSSVVLTGDAGVGKSRILRECAASKSTAATVLAQCGTGTVPRSDLLSQVAEGLHCSGSAASPVQQTLLFEALSEACRRRPVVVLVDDAHRAQPGELRALDMLVSLAQRMRLVVVAAYLHSSGSVEAKSHLRRWLGAGAFQLRVDPLSDAEMELLVRNLIARAAQPLGTDVLREVLASAQGNPRTAAELVVAAAEAGARTPLVAPSARTTVDIAREALTKTHFELLALCSVVGDVFHDSWIVQVAQRPSAIVAEALQAASDLGIIVENGASPGWFTFRQTAVRKALYASLVSLKRIVLHERIVQHLSGRELDLSGTQHGVLVAQHWHALQNHENAAEWLGRAADGLAERGEFSAAGDLYARAAGHLQTGSARWFHVQQQQLRCYSNLAEWASAIPVVRAMLATIDREHDAKAADDLLWDLFFAHLNNGERDEAAKVAREICALRLPERPNRSERATLILAYGTAYAGHREEARRLLDEVTFDELSDADARLRYLIASASIDALHQPIESSLALVDRAATIAGGLGIRGTALCYGDGVEISMRFGDIEKAADYLQRMARTATRSAGEDNGVKRLLKKDHVKLCLLEGDVAAARELVCSSLGWREGGRHNQAFLAGAGVYVGMRSGDFALVDALFDHQLLAASVAASDAESAGHLLAGFAEVMQARGLAKELRALLTHCVEERLIDPYAWIPLCAVRFGSADCVERAVEVLDDYLRDAIAPAGAAHRTLARAVLLRRRGKHIAACEAAREGAERYRRIGWRLLAALALEIAGDFEQASSLYESCGATLDALRLAGGQRRKARRAPFGARLTARELEVARLVANRRSTADIARALEISVRTVHHHLEAAFNKLGVRARWQLTPELLEGGHAQLGTPDVDGPASGRGT